MCVITMCVLIGHCAGHSNYRPTGNRQARSACAMWYQLLFTANFSSLAIVKFKLVLVIKIQHWVPIIIM